MARAGEDLARRLRPGDVVLLRGDVGAGKTTLIRAALRELGVKGTIPSPTFAIGRTYEIRSAEGCPLALSHLDLHRLGAEEEEDPGLLSDYFGPDRIALVEWPEGMEGFLDSAATRLLEVRIRHRDENSRLLRPAAPVTR